MVGKTFTIFSDSAQYLNAESVAEALLSYFTLDPAKADTVFGVYEVKAEKENLKKNSVGLQR